MASKSLLSSSFALQLRDHNLYLNPLPCRVITAVKRFSKAEDQPSEAEDALLFWVNQSLHALRFTIVVLLCLGFTKLKT